MNGDAVKGRATLIEEQKAHFDAFGFLVLREALSAEEMRRIDCEYDEIMTEALPEQGLRL